MRSEIPISIAKYNAIDLIYFDANNVFSMPLAGTAYLALQTCGNIIKEEIRCYLNGEEQEAAGFDRNSIHSNWCKNEFLLDISKIFFPLASGMKENRGFLLEYGQNCIYSYRLIFEFAEGIFAPMNIKNIFHEDSFYICNQDDFAVSPFFLISNTSAVTFVVENMGKQSIFLSMENSPDAHKTFSDSQKIQVLPMELGLIVPMYFTKYVRLRISGGQNAILARIWYQTQQIK